MRTCYVSVDATVRTVRHRFKILRSISAPVLRKRVGGQCNGWDKREGRACPCQSCGSIPTHVNGFGSFDARRITAGSPSAAGSEPSALSVGL